MPRRNGSGTLSQPKRGSTRKRQSARRRPAPVAAVRQLPVRSTAIVIGAVAGLLVGALLVRNLMARN